MRKLVLPLLLGISLQGCSTIPPGNCSTIVPRAYTRAEETELAHEIQTAPASAIWPHAMVDYFQLRAAVFACEK